MKPSDLKCHALRDAVFTGCVKCQVECWTCRSFKVTLPSRCTYRNEKKPNKKKEKSYVGLEAQPQEERSGTSHFAHNNQSAHHTAQVEKFKANRQPGREAQLSVAG